jgi:hypothetical protein
MNEEAYHNGYGMDLWIGSDWIWDPELQMRSTNVWDMTESKHCLLFVSLGYTNIFYFPSTSSFVYKAGGN